MCANRRARLARPHPRHECVYSVRIARLNVYVPDELADRVRSADVNVSAVVQAALAEELDRRATNAWLDALPPLRGRRSHEAAIQALDEVRDEFGEPS
ncbi:type II toxin-antitoxin system CcdA family antitoxin [Mycobacterium shinjukuense]|nr:type II toxin-antitoxin system CcdA family antitoxin [Mycobacterium shinjukuense]MCV6985302.1 type II toxin-antitoxin system CcdA family antitoxin [Mycobacterium shinjukuense]